MTKHSSLLDPLVSLEENEVLGIQPQGPYTKHFIFLTYQWVQLPKALYNNMLKRVPSDKTLKLIGPISKFGRK